VSYELPRINKGTPPSASIEFTIGGRYKVVDYFGRKDYAGTGEFVQWLKVPDDPNRLLPVFRNSEGLLFTCGTKAEILPIPSRPLKPVATQ
jgi:hypothetical protein